MKKYLILLTLISLFVPTSILAEENINTTNVRNTIRQRIETKVREVKTNVLERKEERVERRQERRDGSLQNHADRLSNRFSIYYERLSKIISKVEERFAVIEENGKDLTLAKEKLELAKSKLEEAKMAADEAVSLFESVEPEKYEDQKEVALKARDMANTARKLFLEVKSLINEAVRIAKGVSR